MARNTFGGTAADYTFTLVRMSERLVPVVAPATLTFWDAETGGTRYTDLLLDGVPVESISTDTSGQIPSFLGPDGVDHMWADGGAGRVLIYCNGGIVGPSGPEGPVHTVAGVAPDGAGNVDLTAADVSAVAVSLIGTPNGVASLGPDGLLPTSQIPAVAYGTVYAVASQAAMLALSAIGGDVAARTDGAGSFMLKRGGNPATLADWVRLNAPTDAVVSVNGQIGTVNLAASDVGAVPTVRQVNGHPLSANVTVTASDVGAVPTVRTVNSHPLSSDVTVTAADVGAATSTGGGREGVAALSATSGTCTGNCSAASIFTVTPTGNITLAFSNVPAAPDGCSVRVRVSQGATARTVSPPSGTINGTIPAQQANKVCLIDLMTLDGGSTWDVSGVVL